jgi:putative molybdopterin biosynthesis protein
MLKPGHHKLVSFARRTQGLMVAPGNPLGIASLADLCRPRLRFANRSRGSGTRVVLEELLAQQKIAPERIGGFESAEPSHRAAAEAVASGSADASFGIEAAAMARGLDFVPLAREQYFLVTLQHALDQPQVQTLLSLLRSEAWRAQLNALPGYAAEGSGEVLSLRRVLPWWSYRKPKRASP